MHELVLLVVLPPVEVHFVALQHDPVRSELVRLVLRIHNAFVLGEGAVGLAAEVLHHGEAVGLARLLGAQFGLGRPLLGRAELLARACARLKPVRLVCARVAAQQVDSEGARLLQVRLAGRLACQPRAEGLGPHDGREVLGVLFAFRVEDCLVAALDDVHLQGFGRRPGRLDLRSDA